MDNVAILVDGGFYQKRAKYYDKASRTGVEGAAILHEYCLRHLSHQENKQNVRDTLYRIFYYDCPPLDKNVYHPFKKQQISMKNTDLYSWMTSFQAELLNKRKVALRLGRLSDNDLGFTLSKDAVKKLCSGSKTIADLTESDFRLDTQQKGVDMRIGVDIASMAFKKQVSKIILIAGDSDFVPAAKLARREGIDFVLNPMGASINPELNEHIDGLTFPKYDAESLLRSANRRYSKDC